MAPCSLVEANRRFRGAYCLWNVGQLNETTRRFSEKAWEPEITSKAAKIESWVDCKFFQYWRVLWDFKFSRRRVWCSELSSGLYCRVRGGSVSTVSDYRPEVRSPDFSSSLCVQTGSRAIQSPIQFVPRVLSPGLKHCRGITLTTKPLSIA
jgi:hypothetical protein